ncbi:hypothetical protein HYH03_002370 [Edaphochlamys debaryana]|uniref:Guanylate cyclase domain-containing protein n=1 Tax=Edaphochlamys debaryana TaxID=47281 RepID=A0A836C4Y8_9CHLO|nr:hypothetical protein HYH03_002370 [Edaphochlamys debaryana]|eukprot:KAG2499423.1 hypothetical protein HYH03_002370 [Edaphochlamys debaryana]
MPLGGCLLGCFGSRADARQQQEEQELLEHGALNQAGFISRFGPPDRAAGHAAQSVAAACTVRPAPPRAQRGLLVDAGGGKDRRWEVATVWVCGGGATAAAYQAALTDLVARDVRLREALSQAASASASGSYCLIRYRPAAGTPGYVKEGELGYATVELSACTLVLEPGRRCPGLLLQLHRPQPRASLPGPHGSSLQAPPSEARALGQLTGSGAGTMGRVLGLGLDLAPQIAAAAAAAAGKAPPVPLPPARAAPAGTAVAAEHGQRLSASPRRHLNGSPCGTATGMGAAGAGAGKGASAGRGVVACTPGLAAAARAMAAEVLPALIVALSYAGPRGRRLREVAYLNSRAREYLCLPPGGALPPGLRARSLLRALLSLEEPALVRRLHRDAATDEGFFATVRVPALLPAGDLAGLRPGGGSGPGEGEVQPHAEGEEGGSSDGDSSASVQTISDLGEAELDDGPGTPASRHTPVASTRRGSTDRASRLLVAGASRRGSLVMSRTASRRVAASRRPSVEVPQEYLGSELRMLSRAVLSLHADVLRPGSGALSPGALAAAPRPLSQRTTRHVDTPPGGWVPQQGSRTGTGMGADGPAVLGQSVSRRSLSTPRRSASRRTRPSLSPHSASAAPAPLAPEQSLDATEQALLERLATSGSNPGPTPPSALNPGGGSLPRPGSREVWQLAGRLVGPQASASIVSGGSQGTGPPPGSASEERPPLPAALRLAGSAQAPVDRGGAGSSAPGEPGQASSQAPVQPSDLSAGAADPGQGQGQAQGLRPSTESAMGRGGRRPPRRVATLACGHLSQLVTAVAARSGSLKSPLAAAGAAEAGAAGVAGDAATGMERGATADTAGVPSPAASQASASSSSDGPPAQGGGAFGRAARPANGAAGGLIAASAWPPPSAYAAAPPPEAASQNASQMLSSAAQDGDVWAGFAPAPSRSAVQRSGGGLSVLTQLAGPTLSLTPSLDRLLRGSRTADQTPPLPPHAFSPPDRGYVRSPLSQAGIAHVAAAGPGGSTGGPASGHRLRGVQTHDGYRPSAPLAPEAFAAAFASASPSASAADGSAGDAGSPHAASAAAASAGTEHPAPPVGRSASLSLGRGPLSQVAVAARLGLRAGGSQSLRQLSSAGQEAERLRAAVAAGGSRSGVDSASAADAAPAAAEARGSFGGVGGGSGLSRFSTAAVAAAAGAAAAASVDSLGQQLSSGMLDFLPQNDRDGPGSHMASMLLVSAGALGTGGAGGWSESAAAAAAAAAASDGSGCASRPGEGSGAGQAPRGRRADSGDTQALLLQLTGPMPVGEAGGLGSGPAPRVPPSTSPSVSVGRRAAAGSSAAGSQHSTGSGGAVAAPAPRTWSNASASTPAAPGARPSTSPPMSAAALGFAPAPTSGALGTAPAPARPQGPGANSGGGWYRGGASGKSVQRGKSIRARVHALLDQAEAAEAQRTGSGSLGMGLGMGLGASGGLGGAALGGGHDRALSTTGARRSPSAASSASASHMWMAAGTAIAPESGSGGGRGAAMAGALASGGLASRGKSLSLTPTQAAAAAALANGVRAANPRSGSRRHSISLSSAARYVAQDVQGGAWWPAEALRGPVGSGVGPGESSVYTEGGLMSTGEHLQSSAMPVPFMVGGRSTLASLREEQPGHTTGGAGPAETSSELPALCPVSAADLAAAADAAMASAGRSAASTPAGASLVAACSTGGSTAPVPIPAPGSSGWGHSGAQGDVSLPTGDSSIGQAGLGVFAGWAHSRSGPPGSPQGHEPQLQQGTPPSPGRMGPGGAPGSAPPGGAGWQGHSAGPGARPATQTPWRSPQRPPALLMPQGPGAASAAASVLSPRGGSTGGPRPSLQLAPACSGGGSSGGRVTAAGARPSTSPSLWPLAPVPGRATAPPPPSAWCQLRARTCPTAEGGRVLLLTLTDVTAAVQTQERVAGLVEQEHRILEALFPRHVIAYLTAPPSRRPAARALRSPGPAGAGAAGAGAAESGTDTGPESARGRRALSGQAPGVRRMRSGLAGGSAQRRRRGSAVAPEPPAGGGGAGGDAAGGVEASSGAPGLRLRALAAQHQAGSAAVSHLARQHAAVTILYSDVVGFTAFSRQVPPITVMRFLNELYQKLDALLDIFKVYKVETIGDCYVVAGGLVRYDEDGFCSVLPEGETDSLHAVRCMEFAKAMLRASRSVVLPTTGQPVQVRLGLHSGPAMSGVVGSKMPRFTVFGETVELAHRMEASGRPGRIHVSGATRALLRREAWERAEGVPLGAAAAGAGEGEGEGGGGAAHGDVSVGGGGGPGRDAQAEGARHVPVRLRVACEAQK